MRQHAAADTQHRSMAWMCVCAWPPYLALASLPLSKASKKNLVENYYYCSEY